MGKDPDPGIRTLYYGPGSGFCSFRQWLSRCQQKKVFFPYLFRLLLSVDTYISIFLAYGSKDPDSALFVSDTQDANEK